MISGKSAATLGSLACLILLLGLVLLAPFMQMSGQLADGGAFYRHIGYVTLFFVLICLQVRGNYRRSLRCVITPLIPTFCWFALSLFWAEAWFEGLSRFSLLLLVYFGMFWSVADLGYSQSLLIFRVTLSFLLLLNFLVSLFWPAVGVHPDAQLWRGMMGHKNIAGFTCAVTVLLFALDGAAVSRAIRIVVIAAGILFLLLSGSRTAIISLGAGMAAALTLRYVGPRLIVGLASQRLINVCAVVLVVVIILTVGMMTFLPEQTLSLTNNAGSISQRSTIWRPMLQYYLDHPALGSGYGSYWSTPEVHANSDAFATQKWLKDVDQGHNGYLDILVQTGIIGFTLLLIGTVIWPASQVVAVVKWNMNRASLIYGVIVFCLVENVTESSILADDTIGNAVLLFALALLRLDKAYGGGDTYSGRRRSKRGSIQVTTGSLDHSRTG
jgi:exopolysaccharide production protein ExoQ